MSGITRPKLSQINTAVVAFRDPITVIHAGATSADVDIGFLMNRANGLLANVAIYWNESGNTFVTAFTSNSGATDSNIVPNSYANFTTGNIYARKIYTNDGLYWAGNGDVIVTGGGGGSTYSNVDVEAYIGSNIGSINANITAANSAIQTLSANIGTLIAGAPAALDTLSELSNALGNSSSFSSTMVNWLGNITSNVTAANTSINSFNANLGAYQTYANANIGVLFNGNASTNANLGAYQTWANTNFGTSTYSNTNVEAYIGGNIGAYQTYANTTVAQIQANLGAYQTYANANLGTATTNITTLFSNAATQTTSINTIDANVGAYQTYANANLGTATTNITTLFSNAATQATALNTFDANLGAYQTYANANAATQTTSIDSINANVGAYQTYANANAATQTTSINSIDANIGAYQTYANANAATQSTSINAINANVGAYQIWSNANSSTQATSIDSVNANIGAFQTFANANAATQATSINTINANLGSFQSYANTKIGTNTNSNLVVVATTTSTSTTTGALVVRGGSGIAGSVYIGGSLNVGTGASSSLTGAGALTINSSNNLNLLVGSTSDGTAGSLTLSAGSDVASGTPGDMILYLTYGGSSTGALYVRSSNNTNLLQVIDFPNVNLSAGSGGPLIVTGGARTTGNLYIGGAARIVSANTSTSTTTGALVVGGGVGIGGALYITNTGDVSANIGAFQTFANANAATQATSINTVNANIGAFQIFSNSNAATQATSINTFNANLGAYQAYANTNAATQTTSIDSVNSNVTAANSSINTFNANIGAYQIYANTKIGTNTNGNLVVIANTASTDATTGALVVKGGVGIGGDMNIAGNIVPAANVTYDLGSSTNWFRDLWLSSGTIHIGGAQISQDSGTGAVVIIPQITQDNPNPVATIFSPTGAVTSANTAGGTVSSANVAAAIETNDFSITGRLTANTATVINDMEIGGNLTIIGVGDIRSNLGNATTNITTLFGNATTQATSIDTINANVGAYQIYANANAATQAVSIDSVNANIGAYQTYANANAATQTTSINSINANIGAYQTYANANAATQTTSINSINANIGAYQIYANANATTQATSINSIDANVGAYQTYANTIVVAIQANLGAYQTYANANAATQATSIDLINLNITAANNAIQTLSANIGTLVAGAPGALDTLLELGNALGNSGSFSSTMVNWLGNITSNVTAANSSINTFNANLGAYQTYANTNAATQATSINSIDANIGAYQTYANITFSVSSYSNTNVEAYIGGNIGAYQTYANANAATQATSINTVNANVAAANSAIQTLSANIGTLVAGAPGALDTLLELANALGNSSSFSSTMVNWLGNITSNITAANTSINSFNANLGAYQTFANANAATQATSINSIDANLGTAATNITTLFGNAASQAISITSLATGANANTAAYLTTYTGNVQAGNISVTGNVNVTSNVFANKLYTTNGLYWAGNGNVILTGGGSLISGNTAPASPSVGDFWYKISVDILYQYINDGTTSYWIDVQSPILYADTSPTSTLNETTITGNLIPSANITYSLGTATNRFKDLFLSGSTIDLGGATIKTDASSGAIALIPQPTAANPNPTGIVVSPAGTVSTVATTGGQLTATAIGNSSNSAVASATTTFGNIVVTGNITTANLIANSNVVANKITTTTGFFWSNGIAFASSTYGNTEVAAYLTSNVSGLVANTSGIQLPKGNTAQRPANPQFGSARFNTDLDGLEVYTSAGWRALAAPPSISTVTPSTYSGTSGAEFVINGEAFSSDAQVYFVTANSTALLAASVSYYSAVQIRATTPRAITVAEEPISVRVTQQSGTVTKTDCIDAGGVPVWATTAGTLGSIFGANVVTVALSASDPDGNAIVYSIASGSLPGGLSLTSGNGAINGTATSVLANTTYNFTIRASDTINNTDRAFSYTILNRPPVVNTAAGSLGTVYSGNAVPSATIDAYDPDGGNVTFDVASGSLPANTSLGSANGVIQGSTILVTSNTTYTFSIRATDEGSGVASTTYTYTILNRPPVWNTAATLSSFNSDTFTPITINAYDPDGGNVTYSLTSGSVPGGLSFANANATIIGTPNEVTSNTTSTFTVTATDVGSDANARTFSLTITPTLDPYINFTTLLLHADADTVIKDTSTNNLPITVIADSRASNFNPYNTSWSGYFNGSSSIRTVANANLAIGTGDVTYEMWFNTTTSADYNALFGTTNESAWQDNSYTFVYHSSGISLYNGNGGGVLWSIATGTIHDGIWHHIAIVRSSGTWKVFVDGVSKGTTVTQGARSLGGNTWRFTVGGMEPSNTTGWCTGYISNFRMNNTALYSANFTPSTTPLTAVAGTLLLTCQSNRFVDNSLSPIAFTAGSFPQIVGLSPFAETDTSNGSMYFDGTGDYLTIPNNTAFSYNSTFSAELWYYSTHTSCTDVIPFSGNDNWDFIIPTATTVAFRWFVPGYGDTNAHTMIPSSWNHIAVAVSGGRLSFYLNGTRMYTNASVSFSLGGSSTSKIGYGGNSLMKGYISNVRVTRGSTPYDPTQTTITVPTSPLTTVSGTTFLTLQNRKGHNNHAFIDESKNKSLITRFSNTTQGSFSPFSQTGWSNFFDGTDDRLVTSSSLLTYGTATASTTTSTIEVMVYLNGYGSAVSDSDDTSIISKGSTYGNFCILDDGRLMWYHYDGSLRTPTSTGTVPLNAWTHVAATISGGVVTFYINGSACGTGTWYGMAQTSDPVYIGEATGASSQSVKGYLSNLRVSSIVRAITVPTAPLVTDAYTNLLTCQSNRFVDNSSNGYAITVSTGTPSVQAFSPFLPTDAYSTSVVGGSMYFDGASDYLSFIDSSNLLDLGGSIASIECWFYPTAAGTSVILSKGGGTASFDATNGFIWQVQWVGGIFKFIFCNAGTNNNIEDPTTRPLNQWYHVAVATDTSNNISLYVNGTRVGTATNAITKVTNRTIVNIGQDVSSNWYAGYASGLHFIRGTGAYTAASSTITVPTIPPTAVANTVLLINGTNGAIFDSTAKNVLETVGSAAISTTQSKFGGSAMYCPATNGNYFLSPYNQPNFVFGTGNFTVEAWLYPTAFTNNANSPFGYGVNGGGGATWWNLEFNTSGTAIWIDNDALRLTASSNLSLNTWTHVAVVRTNTAVTLYYNGVSVGTTATISNITGSATSRLCVMTGTQDIGGRQFIGYIDDLRITKGYARYTANFTAPTKAFPNS